MRIAMWPIDRVQPYDKNPRINDEAVDAVARSLQEFGFRQPIVVDEQDTIIVGHTRWKAAQRLGLKKVPVHVAQDLTPAQIKAYRIADNQTGNIATWDFHLLPLELAKRLNPDLQDGQCDPDDISAPPDEATTQPRDRWILGDGHIRRARRDCENRQPRAANPNSIRGDLPAQPRDAVRWSGPSHRRIERRRTCGSCSVAEGRPPATW